VTTEFRYNVHGTELTIATGKGGASIKGELNGDLLSLKSDDYLITLKKVKGKGIQGDSVMGKIE
jgi:hypothetical protein